MFIFYNKITVISKALKEQEKSLENENNLLYCIHCTWYMPDILQLMYL